jgi:hypothetical protein
LQGRDELGCVPPGGLEKGIRIGLGKYFPQARPASADVELFVEMKLASNFGRFVRGPWYHSIKVVRHAGCSSEEQLYSVSAAGKPILVQR